MTQLLKTMSQIILSNNILGVALEVCRSGCGKFWGFGKMRRSTPVGEAGCFDYISWLISARER